MLLFLHLAMFLSNCIRGYSDNDALKQRKVTGRDLNACNAMIRVSVFKDSATKGEGFPLWGAEPLATGAGSPALNGEDRGGRSQAHRSRGAQRQGLIVCTSALDVEWVQRVSYIQ